MGDGPYQILGQHVALMSFKTEAKRNDSSVGDFEALLFIEKNTTTRRDATTSLSDNVRLLHHVSTVYLNVENLKVPHHKKLSSRGILVSLREKTRRTLETPQAENVSFIHKH